MRVCIAVACRDVQFFNTSRTAVFANLEGRNASIDAILLKLRKYETFYSESVLFFWNYFLLISTALFGNEKETCIQDRYFCKNN